MTYTPGDGRTQFLSTPSVRRATLAALLICQHLFDFYPRPPCGGRPMPWHSGSCDNVFLSTPSVRRATRHIGDAKRHIHKFLSTPSVRRATDLM